MFVIRHIEQITTPHLVLRKARETDTELIWQNVWCDEKLAATMLWQPTKTREEAALRMEKTIAIQKDNLAFFVCLKETDEPIGFAGIREIAPGAFEETGLCIARAHQGCGYGKEVLRALIDLAFRKAGGRRFEYGCFHDNIPSAALCKSCGFVYTHSTTETRKWDGYEYLCDFYVLKNFLTIRMATPADAEAIYQIYVPYVRDTAISFEITAPTLDEFRERIRKTLLEYPYLVAEEDGKIVGYAYASAFHGREAYRHTAETSIYVERSKRRHGIGRVLYAELEKACAEQNIFTLYACVTATDRADDPYLGDDSLRFHKTVGYREIGRHENCGYKFDRWYGIIWLEKQIADRPAHPEPFRPITK